MPHALDPSILFRITLFRGLASEQLSRLGPLLHQRSFPAGANFITAEEPGESAYFILTGSAKVHDTQPDGTDVVLAIAPRRLPREPPGDRSLPRRPTRRRRGASGRGLHQTGYQRGRLRRRRGGSRARRGGDLGAVQERPGGVQSASLDRRLPNFPKTESTNGVKIRRDKLRRMASELLETTEARG